MVVRSSAALPVPGASEYISSICASVASPTTSAANDGRIAAATSDPRNTDQNSAVAIQKQGSETTRRGTFTTSDRSHPSRLKDSIR